MSKAQVAKIEFDNFLQENWTVQETENAKVVVDFFSAFNE